MKKLCWSLLAVFICAMGMQSREISLKKTMIYGPGLNSKVVLPARYFYIQTVDSKGKK